jgi:hypothetical protein
MNCDQCEAPQLTVIDQFIADFEDWVYSDFSRLLFKRAWETPDPLELTVMWVPWVNRLRHCGESGALRTIGSEGAARLRFVMNRALDGLSDEYRRWGTSDGTMMGALWPLDDILAYLSLAASLHTELSVTVPMEVNHESDV